MEANVVANAILACNVDEVLAPERHRAGFQLVLRVLVELKLIQGIRILSLANAHRQLRSLQTMVNIVCEPESMLTCVNSTTVGIQS